jgi:hypothetical protein
MRSPLDRSTVSRRLMLKGGAILASAAIVSAPSSEAAVPIAEPMIPVAIPPQAPANAELAVLPGISGIGTRAARVRP